MIVLEGARAITGLCVDVCSGVLINESNYNMQPITIKFAVRTIHMPLACLSERFFVYAVSKLIEIRIL